MKTIASLKHAHATLDELGVATLTIREAGTVNILSTPVSRDLTAVLNEMADTPEIRVLIFRGSGDQAFVAGANINEMATLNRKTAVTFISNL
ncbi:MAG: hypothetical protein RLZZ481_2899, partial [Pseudomonadota bacterium]